jgi:hypothetical protein
MQSHVLQEIPSTVINSTTFPFKNIQTNKQDWFNAWHNVNVLLPTSCSSQEIFDMYEVFILLVNYCLSLPETIPPRIWAVG